MRAQGPALIIEIGIVPLQSGTGHGPGKTGERNRPSAPGGALGGAAPQPCAAFPQREWMCNLMSVFNIFTLLGGLAMFLYGMDVMGKSL